MGPVYAPHGFAQSVRETLAGQMQHIYFPIQLEQLGATIRYHDLTEGVFAIGDIKIRTQYLNHPALTLGYRLEADGVSVVYCCDHEPHSRSLAYGTGEVGGQDQRHAEFIAGCDLLIHDAQYRVAEYETKIGWGHSTIEYAVAMAQLAGVKSLALTHHDPSRDDDTIDREVELVRARLQARSSPLHVFAAAEGPTLDLKPHPGHGPERKPEEPAAEVGTLPHLSEQTVLLGIADQPLYDELWRTLHTDGIRVLHATDSPSVLRLAQTDKPSLIMLDRDLLGVDSLETCKAIRTLANADGGEVPVVIVAAQEDVAGGMAAGVTDWLIRPFSSLYARTRMRALLMRVACHWVLPPVPADEERRLASLHCLAILDTEPEERFDKLTRLTAAMFDVPIALVSLVDENRQWFKSLCGGVSVTESPREISFCAHAILQREVMIVPDALLDTRFADNPVVVNDSSDQVLCGMPAATARRRLYRYAVPA